MARFIQQFSGKLLCLICTRELSPSAARFHVLHCKEHTVTGMVVDGQRQRADML